MGGRGRSFTHGYVVEGRLGFPGRLLGVIFVGMDGSGAETLFYFLVGFHLGWSLQPQSPLGRAREAE